MTISENITQDDILDATTTNRAILQERFPFLDLSVGGPVDSLLVDGNVIVTARNDADVDRAYLYQQLQAISEGTVEVSDEEVDRLMANYFLTRTEEEPATGKVVFIVRDDVTYSFQAGYTLRTGNTDNQTYQLPINYTIYPTGTTNVDFTAEGNVLLETVYDFETGYLYRFEVDVESLVATPEAVLEAGERLVVDQGFEALGYVEASTNFQGGTERETNQEFTTRGLEGMLCETIGGQDHIKKVIIQAVPRSDSWAIGTGDATMSRDRNNVYNISTGGKIDVYYKAGAIAQSGFPVDATVVDDVTRTIEIRLSREESAGVYRQEVLPLYTSTPPEIVSGGITVDAVDHEVWTPDDPFAFNPDMPDEYDRAFSSRQEIVLTVTDDRQDSGGFVVDMSGGPGTVIEDSYQVSTDYQPELITVDDAITAAEVRPPGTDVLPKAAVPAVTTLGVVATRPPDYNGPDAESIERTLASLINALPITTVFLDEFTVSNLLYEASPDLIFNSAAFNATIYGQNDVDYAITSVQGKLVIPTITEGKIEPYNTYFVTSVGLVSVTLV